MNLTTAIRARFSILVGIASPEQVGLPPLVAGIAHTHSPVGVTFWTSVLGRLQVATGTSGTILGTRVAARRQRRKPCFPKNLTREDFYRIQAARSYGMPTMRSERINFVFELFSTERGFARRDHENPMATLLSRSGDRSQYCRPVIGHGP